MLRPNNKIIIIYKKIGNNKRAIHVFHNKIDKLLWLYTSLYFWEIDQTSPFDKQRLTVLRDNIKWQYYLTAHSVFVFPTLSTNWYLSHNLNPLSFSVLMKKPIFHSPYIYLSLLHFIHFLAFLWFAFVAQNSYLIIKITR